MKLEDIQNLWDQDREIDQYDLSTEALKIPYLHGKYYRIFIQERLRLVQMLDELKLLKFKKHEFYIDGPCDETPTEWLPLMPARGRIIKSDVDRYIEVDPDVVTASQLLQMQTEKTKFIESIISGLRERGYAIKNSLDAQRFSAGG